MAAKNVYSVGQVNTYIRNMFAEDFLLRNLCVRGEVSNLKYHTSGHIYFTLKDASGTLSCIMFAGRAARGLSFRMNEGDAVLVTGSVSVWTKGGTYQLYADRIEKFGAGLLNEKYEELKKKLEEMGLFAEEYKQPVPKYIKRLGVVTAPTGAAVRDIINIAKRRNPYIQIILYPALVQGIGAKESIVRGIYALDHLGDKDPKMKVDVIIIGRGGGSLEDLWAFNEEMVAQAVFDCSTPIISAVGHETDTVITDYVADLRAPTPSAGAELAVYDVSRYLLDVKAFEASLETDIFHSIEKARSSALLLRRQLSALSPAMKLREKRTTLMHLEESIQDCMEDKIYRARQELKIEDRLTSDMAAVLYRTKQGLLMKDTLVRDMNTILTQRKHTMQLLAGRLDAASPLKRLSGGYAFLTDKDGAAITSAEKIQPGDTLDIRMRDGRVFATADEVTLETKRGTGR